MDFVRNWKYKILDKNVHHRLQSATKRNKYKKFEIQANPKHEVKANFINIFFLEIEMI